MDRVARLRGRLSRVRLFQGCDGFVGAGAVRLAEDASRSISRRLVRQPPPEDAARVAVVRIRLGAGCKRSDREHGREEKKPPHHSMTRAYVMPLVSFFGACAATVLERQTFTRKFDLAVSSERDD